MNFNENFKPGDKVVITGDNRGRPGGHIGGHVGQVYTLKEYDRGHYHDHLANETPGYWRMEEVRFVWNATEFRLAEKRAEEVKEVKFQDMLYKYLYKIAKEKGIAGRSGLDKEGLIKALSNLKDKVVGPPAFSTVFLERAKKSEHGCCHFAYEMEKGEHIFNFQAPCYAALNRSPKGIKNMWVDVTIHHREHDDKPAYEAWVDYVLGESPVKDVFETHSFKQAFAEGVRIDASKMGVSKIAVACTMLRGGSEFPHHAIAFKKLVDLGIPKKVAFVIANNVVYDKKKNNFLVRCLSGAHQWFNFYDTSWDDFVKFMNEGFHIPAVLKEVPFTNRNGQYLMQKAVANYADKNICQQVFNKFLPSAMSKKPGDWYETADPLQEKQVIEAAFKLAKIL